MDQSLSLSCGKILRSPDEEATETLSLVPGRPPCDNWPDLRTHTHLDASSGTAPLTQGEGEEQIRTKGTNHGQIALVNESMVEPVLVPGNIRIDGDSYTKQDGSKTRVQCAEGAAAIRRSNPSHGTGIVSVVIIGALETARAPILELRSEPTQLLSPSGAESTPRDNKPMLRSIVQSPQCW